MFSICIICILGTVAPRASNSSVVTSENQAITASTWNNPNDNSHDLKSPELNWRPVLNSNVWSKTYNVSVPPNNGYVNLVTTTNDGNYVVASPVRRGVTWVFKLNPRGNILWQFTYGTSGETVEPSAVVPASDGGSLVVGSVFHLLDRSSVDKALVMKLSVNGVLQWAKFYGVNSVFITSAKQVLDTGYVLAGYSFAAGDANHPVGGWLARINTLGQIQWQHEYVLSSSNLSYEFFHSVDNAPRNGFILGGIILEGSVESGWIVRTDNLGNVLWSSRNVPARGAVVTVGNNFIVVGRVFQSNYTSLVLQSFSWLIRLDDHGNAVQQATYSVGGNFSEFTGVQATGKNEFVVTGDSVLNAAKFVPNEFANPFLLKFNLNLNMVWSKIFNISARPTSITLAHDNGLVVAGYSETRDTLDPFIVADKVWVAKTNSQGNCCNTSPPSTVAKHIIPLPTITALSIQKQTTMIGSMAQNITVMTAKGTETVQCQKRPPRADSDQDDNE